jgi:hypothetical protein
MIKVPNRRRVGPLIRLKKRLVYGFKRILLFKATANVRPLVINVDFDNTVHSIFFSNIICSIFLLLCLLLFFKILR